MGHNASNPVGPVRCTFTSTVRARNKWPEGREKWPCAPGTGIAEGIERFPQRTLCPNPVNTCNLGPSFPESFFFFFFLGRFCDTAYIYRTRYTHINLREGRARFFFDPRGLFITAVPSSAVHVFLFGSRLSDAGDKRFASKLLHNGTRGAEGNEKNKIK